MKIVTTVPKLRSLLRPSRLRSKRIGFVPTMGALHEGHAALLRRCRRENDLVVLSIFVNPTQFGPDEDYRIYPRTRDKDVLLAKQEKTDIMFCPSVKEIYPGSFLTSIHVPKISDVLCGAFRPGHFGGVALVVTKLLNIVAPDVLYLGQKDAQQCVVIRQLIRDLNLPVKVRIVPTVRAPDGLALSSRNQYLTARQRQEAPVLYRALCSARTEILKGERRVARIVSLIKKMIRQKSSGQIQYVKCVQAETLTPLTKIQGRVLMALAVWFGKARLIDNIVVSAQK